MLLCSRTGTQVSSLFNFFVVGDANFQTTLRHFKLLTVFAPSTWILSTTLSWTRGSFRSRLWRHWKRECFWNLAPNSRRPGELTLVFMLSITLVKKLSVITVNELKWCSYFDRFRSGTLKGLQHMLSSFKVKASESSDQGRRHLFKCIFSILWVILAYFVLHIFFYRWYFAIELQQALKLWSMFISCDDCLSPDRSFCFIFSSVTKSDGSK